MALLVKKETDLLDNLGFDIGGGGEGEDERFRRFNDPEDFYRECADIVARAANKSQEQINIALSGGSASKLYSYINERIANIFGDVNFWQVDERFVDHEDENSNFKLLHESFLDKTDYKSFEFFNVDLADPKKIVDNYEEKLRKNFIDKKLDLVVLGVGEDGHTASIFPNSNLIKENSKLAAYVDVSASNEIARFTITFPTILNSEEILVFMCGRNKKDIFEKIVNEIRNGLRVNEKSDLVDNCPIMKILEHPNVKFYFGDF